MFESPSQLLLKGLQCALLFFAFNALTLGGPASGYGFLGFLAAPAAVLYLLSRKEEGLDCQGFGSSALRFYIPFLPFLLAFCIVKIYFWNSSGDMVLDYPAICGIILLCGVCFGALSMGPRISKSMFFTACALGSGFYVADIICTSLYFNVGIWDAKNWVVPYSTTYARAIMIPAGLSFLGFFALEEKKKALRWSCLAAGCAAFIAATGFIAVRAVIPAVGFAFAAALALIFFKKQKRLLWGLVIGAGALVVVLGLSSPLPQKILLGIQESTEVVSTGAANKTLENMLNEKKDGVHHKETAEEEALQKSLNNSMGGRFAVWELAKMMVPKSPVIGYGDGRPSSFVDIKELFKYSTDYLVHFHSDYVQSAMVGGLLLLFGLIGTQLWLIWIARRDPLRLYLIVSICSFGIFEIGFLEVTVFSSFLAAWTLLSAFRNKRSDGSFLVEGQVAD